MKQRECFLMIRKGTLSSTQINFFLFALALCSVQGCLGNDLYVPDAGDTSPDQLPNADSDHGGEDTADGGNETTDADNSDSDTDSKEDVDAGVDTDSDADEDTETDSVCNPDNEPTWDDNVDDIMNSDCASCHPEKVMTYDDVLSWIEEGKFLIYIQRGHYISDTDKTTVLEWLDIGAPQSDCDVRADAPL